MQEVLMEAEGIYCDLELLKDIVRIKRRGVLGFLALGSRTEKDILISKILSIRFKRAGILANGYIQFVFEERQETRDSKSDVAEDENAVVFRANHQKAFESIREAIVQRMTNFKTETKATSGLDELERLASLRDKGVITEDEFAQKKRQLLGL